jgi:hypothetical protein
MEPLTENRPSKIDPSPMMQLGVSVLAAIVSPPRPRADAAG